MSRGSHAITKAAIDLAVDLAFPERPKGRGKRHVAAPAPKPVAPPPPAWVRVVQVVTWGLIPAVFIGGVILCH